MAQNPQEALDREIAELEESLRLDEEIAALEAELQIPKFEGTLSEEESQFQEWYAGHAKRLGLDPNPDDPRHHYDYRAAFKAGEEPDESGHFDSGAGKGLEHPNRFVDGKDTAHVPTPSTYPLTAVTPKELKKLDPRHQLQSDRPGGQKDFITAVQELEQDPLRLLPFIGSGKDVVDAVVLLSAAEDLEKDPTDGAAAAKIAEHLAGVEAEQSFGYNFLSLLSELPAIGGEFAATGPAYRGGALVARKALGKALKRATQRELKRTVAGKLVIKGTEAAAGTAARTMLLPQYALTNTFQRMMPDLTQDEATQMAKVIPDTTQDFIDAFPKGVLDSYLTNLAEVSGGAIGKTFRLDKIHGLQAKVLQRIVGKGDMTKALNTIAGKAGWHGVLPEVGEESLDSLLKAAFSDGEWEAAFPDDEEMALRFAVFAVPGVVSTGLQVVEGKKPTGEKGFLLPSGERISPSEFKAVEEAEAAPEEVAPEEGAEEQAEGKDVPAEAVFPEAQAEPTAEEEGEVQARLAETPTVEEEQVEPEPEVEPAVEEPVQDKTSLTRENINRELVAMGQEPLTEHEGETFEQWNEAANKKMKDDPMAGARLLDELEKTGRGSTPEEGALLLSERTRLRNDRKRIDAALEQAHEEGDEDKLDMLEEQEIENVEAFDRASRVVAEAKSVVGAALAQTKMFQNEDWSLAGMEQELRVAKADKLTKEERAENKALSRDIEKLQETLDKIVLAQSKEIKATETRNKKKLAQLRKEIEEEDFEDRPKRKRLPLTPEGIKVKIELEKKKKEHKQKKRAFRLKRRTVGERVLRLPGEVFDFMRAMRSSFDDSFLFNQGLAFTIFPRVTGKTAISGLKAMSNEKALEIDAGIRNLEIFDRAQAADLKHSELDAALGQHEEAIHSDWAERFPGIKMSNRMFITNANMMRIQLFEIFTRWGGGDMTAAEDKVIAKLINIGTGHGDPAQFGDALRIAGYFLWSPKLNLGRAQLMLGPFTGFSMSPVVGPGLKGKFSLLGFGKGNTLKTRKVIATFYGRMALSAAAVVYLANLMGADFEKDWTSSNFGTFVWGNRRWNPWGSSKGLFVLAMRQITGKKTTGSGRTQRLVRTDEGGPEYGQDSSMDLFWRMFRTKLSPGWAAIWDVRDGENLIGERVTPAQAAVSSVTPLALEDIYEALRDEGASESVAFSLMSWIGISSHQERKPKSGRRRSRSRRR